MFLNTQKRNSNTINVTFMHYVYTYNVAGTLAMFLNRLNVLFFKYVYYGSLLLLYTIMMYILYM